MNHPGFFNPFLEGFRLPVVRGPRMNPCPDCGKPTQGTSANFIGANLHSPRCFACFKNKVDSTPHIEIEVTQ